MLVTEVVKCQACGINNRINNKSLHCDACITEMIKNHTNMLLNGTMNDTPFDGYITKCYIIIDAETDEFLDIFREKRVWGNVVRTITIGNIQLIWKQRTPEEKGLRPYRRINV